MGDVGTLGGRKRVKVTPPVIRAMSLFLWAAFLEALAQGKFAPLLLSGRQPSLAGSSKEEVFRLVVTQQWRSQLSVQTVT